MGRKQSSIKPGGSIEWAGICRATLQFVTNAEAHFFIETRDAKTTSILIAGNGIVLHHERGEICELTVEQVKPTGRVHFNATSETAHIAVRNKPPGEGG